MYDYDLDELDARVPDEPFNEDSLFELQLITSQLEGTLNIIEDYISKMKDLDVCHSVTCEGWNTEALLAAKKLSPVVAEGGLMLPSSCRNLDQEELVLVMESDWVYNTVKFIKDIIKAILTGVKEAIVWFFSQFKPSTHYHAMLKSRKRKVFADVSRVDNAAFKKTVILMEPYEVTMRKIGAILLIYEEITKLTKNHISLMDDTNFSHRTVFDDPLKILGYARDGITQKIKAYEFHIALENKSLEELGWKITNIQNTIDRIITVYEKQPVIKQLTKQLDKLVDDTKETERRMKKVTDDYTKLSKEKERIVVIQQEMLFLISLGKVLINCSHRIAHQYLVLADKVESLKRQM